MRMRMRMRIIVNAGDERMCFVVSSCRIHFRLFGLCPRMLHIGKLSKEASMAVCHVEWMSTHFFQGDGQTCHN